MVEGCLGAYATLEEAEAGKAQRLEPQNELVIRQDGNVEHPYRVWWEKPA
jgi:hypothetical protein